MRYVIMANGEARRWGNFLGKPKHLIEVDDGETLIARTVRLIRETDRAAEVVISAHDPRYEVEGARLYTPPVRDLEIDRFVPDLLDRPCCYLYGDAYYTASAVRRICGEGGSGPLLFFGNEERIFAIRAADPAYTKGLLIELRRGIVEGAIQDCKGWQLYHRHLGLPLAGKAIGRDFVHIQDDTTDFNTPDEYRAFMKRNG